MNINAPASIMNESLARMSLVVNENRKSRDTIDRGPGHPGKSLREMNVALVEYKALRRSTLRITESSLIIKLRLVMNG